MYMEHLNKIKKLERKKAEVASFAKKKYSTAWKRYRYNQFDEVKFDYENLPFILGVLKIADLKIKCMVAELKPLEQEVDRSRDKLIQTGCRIINGDYL